MYISKILITDTGLYVNQKLPCLANYKHCVNLIKFEPVTEAVDREKVIDLSDYKAYADLWKSGFDSWQYQCVQHNAEKIIKAVTHETKYGIDYLDVVILCDLNLEALYILDLLQKSDYDADIHLILPMPFEITVKGSIHQELLSDLSKVKTLAIYDPFKLAMNGYGNTEAKNVEKVIQTQTEHLLGKIFELAKSMPYLGNLTKYFYDFDQDCYVSTDDLFVLDEYEITELLGMCGNPYRYRKMDGIKENAFLINYMTASLPRTDGKKVCEQLRTVRKEFARTNKIEYSFDECTYDGPCSGTCKKCDAEAKELKLLAEKRGKITYPQVILEKSV